MYSHTHQKLWEVAINKTYVGLTSGLTFKILNFRILYFKKGTGKQLVKHQNGEVERGERDTLGLYKKFSYETEWLGKVLSPISHLQNLYHISWKSCQLLSLNWDIESIHLPFFNFLPELHRIVWNTQQVQQGKVPYIMKRKLYENKTACDHDRTPL